MALLRALLIAAAGVRPRAVALGVAVALCAASEARAAPTSVQMFRQAQKAFKEEKFKVAQKILAQIVRKQSDFQPAKMLLGRIFFREGKMAKAYKYFKGISSDLVTPDVAYEFAITMFAKKNYKRAVTGFGRVPSSSKYANLAHFYRGISHARLRDWDKAITWLQRAHDLPPSLEGTRREALSQARRAARSERFNAGPGGHGGIGNPYVIVPTPPPPPAPSYVDPAAAAAMMGGPPPDAGSGSGSGSAAKKPEKPKPPPAGFKNEVTPSLNIEQKAGTTDYFGYQTQKTTSTSSTLKVSYKGKYLADAKPGGGQPYFSLGLDGSQIAASSKGAKTKYIAYSTDPNTILEQEQPVDSASANTFVLFLNPEGAYPVAGKLDVMGGYSFQDTLPDFKADAKTESKGPYGTVSFNGESIDVKGTVKMTDDSDPTGVVTKNTLIVGGDIAKSFETTTIDLGFTQTTSTPTTLPPPGYLGAGLFFGVTQAISLSLTKTFDTFSLNAGVTYTIFAPPAGYIKSEEDNALKISLQGTKSFEFGGQFIVTGGSRQLTGYKVQLDKLPDAPGTGTTPPPTTPPATTPPVDPTQPVDPTAPPVTPKVAVPADGSETSLSVSFKMAPIEWIFGQATFTYTLRSFTMSDPRYEAAFDQAVGETVNELSLVVGLSKTF